MEGDSSILSVDDPGAELWGDLENPGGNEKCCFPLSEESHSERLSAIPLGST